jgi:hypothetical protein
MKSKKEVQLLHQVKLLEEKSGEKESEPSSSNARRFHARAGVRTE